MAWIELHQTVWTHRKTLALAEALDLDDTYAAAHVARLWCWALDNAVLDFDGKRGLLTGMSPRTIATGAAWRGDPGAFYSALIDSGYIDRDGDDLVLHDWWDYAGKYIERREKNADRMRDARAAGKPVAPPPSVETRAAHVQRTSHARAGATVPNLTVPTTLTGGADVAAPPPPVRAVPKPKERDKSATELDPLFPAVVTLFGRPAGTQWGLYTANIKALHELGATPEEVPRRAENYRRVMGTAADGTPIVLTLPALVKHWNLCANPPPVNGHANGHRREPALADPIAAVMRPPTRNREQVAAQLRQIRGDDP